MKNYLTMFICIQFIMVNISLASESDDLINSAMTGEIKIEPKKTIKPEKDDRCDQDFINQLSAKQECFLSADKAACTYLGAVGIITVGLVGSGVGAYLANSIKSLNPNKEFLAKYKKTYEAIKANEVLNKKYLSIVRDSIKKINDEKNDDDNSVDKKMDKLLRRIKNDVISQLNAHEDKSLRLFIEKKLINLSRNEFNVIIDGSINGWINFNKTNEISYRLYLNSIEMLNQEFSEEQKQYYNLKQLYEDKLNLEMTKIDPKYVDDITKLKEEVRTVQLKLKQNTELHEDLDELIELKSKRQDLNEKIDIRNSHHQDLSKEIAKKIYSEFQNVLAEKYPNLVLYYNLNQQIESRAGIFRDQPELLEKLKPSEKKVNAKARAATIRNGVIGRDVGFGFAGLATLPAAQILLNKKLSSCADDLNLSSDEVGVLTNNILGASDIVNCNRLRIKDNKEVLTNAWNKFGFIPKGLCQMATHTEQQFNSLVSSTKAKEVNCDTMNGENFSVDLVGKTKEYTCKGVAGLVYKAPLKDDGFADFENMNAFVNGIERPIYSSKIKETYRHPKALFGSAEDKTPDSRLQSFTQCTVDATESDFCTCVKGAFVAQAALAVKRSVPNQCTTSQEKSKLKSTEKADSVDSRN